MSTRTKATAAVNEAKDIAFIITALHTKNGVGQRFVDSFREKFGHEILDARVREGSNRGTHYDFDILVRSSTCDSWKHVEHKGSKSFRPIKFDEKPWTAGVQFHNGGCEKYSLAKAYARVHYDTHIASDYLKNTFGLTTATPPFEDWFKQDCCVQDDPRSAFGKELKEKVRAIRGPRSSLLNEREPVVNALEFTDDVKQQLIKEVLPIANHALEQKDYWLTICGNLEDGNFNLAWNPKFTIGAIRDVVVTKKKDIMFEFKCSDDFTFGGILRWGKGAGFSCLRVDLK